MRLRTLCVALAALSASAVACANSSDDQTMNPVVLGMEDTVAPIFDDGETQMYEVSTPVALPVRRPKDGERAQGKVDPYPKVPFQLASDTRISVRYTLTNLGDQPMNVWLLFDPWNEFVRYVPGVVVGDEQTTPNLSGRELPYVLPAKSRVEGIVTPDDMVELATDLATAMKLQETPPPADSQFGGPALYNRAMNVQNRSSQPDVVLGPYIPQVVAGITGFDLGIRTFDKAKIAVEIVVDVEDMNGDRVIRPNDTENKPFGRPGTVLQPPPPAAMN